MPATEDSPASIYLPIGTHFIVSGMGPRGLKHCVVYRQEGHGAGEITLVHDPIGEAKQPLISVSSISTVVKL